jgi:adenosylhomocysteine nucleosidase
LELEAFLSGLPGRTDTGTGGMRVHALASEPEWRMAVCGQGKVEAALAAQILADALRPSAVLLLGSATALHADQKLGDVIVAAASIEWDFGADPVPVFKNPFPFPGVPADEVAERRHVATGAILSGDRNVFDPVEKRDLCQRYGAKALAWEGAGFHRFLRRWGKAGWEIRVITETAGSGKPDLAAFKTRMQEHFPALRPLVRRVAAHASTAGD